MNDRILFPLKVGELYRNALAVKRTNEETARDLLYGLPGDLMPNGWGLVETELTNTFSRSAKTINDILGLLREWEESAIRIISDHLDIHPVLDLSRWAFDENASPIRFVLVPKGTSFPTLNAEETKFYETNMKRRTGLVEDCNDWRRYWIEDCGIDSNEMRRNVFRDLEISEALGLLGAKVATPKPHRNPGMERNETGKLKKTSPFEKAGKQPANKTGDTDSWVLFRSELLRHHNHDTRTASRLNQDAITLTILVKRFGKSKSTWTRCFKKWIDPHSRLTSPYSAYCRIVENEEKLRAALDRLSLDLSPERTIAAAESALSPASIRTYMDRKRGEE